MMISPPLIASSVDTWVFDLDNTLYPAVHSLFPQIDERIRCYIARHLDLDQDAAYRLQKTYYREYGTTLRGLMSVHGTDPNDFLDFVHDIDHSVLQPDPRLSAAIASLPGRKLIFTNGSYQHAVRVMERLDVTRHFEDIFDIVAADFIPKPQMQPYEKLATRFNITLNKSVMIEDLERNLVPAAQLGMTTVWFKQEEHPDLHVLGVTPANPPHVHHITEDLIQWLEQVVDSDPSLKPSCV